MTGAAAVQAALVAPAAAYPPDVNTTGLPLVSMGGKKTAWLHAALSKKTDLNTHQRVGRTSVGSAPGASGAQVHPLPPCSHLTARHSAPDGQALRSWPGTPLLSRGGVWLGLAKNMASMERQLSDSECQYKPHTL